MPLPPPHTLMPHPSATAFGHPAGQGTVTTDFGALIDGLKGANCDYSINSQW